MESEHLVNLRKIRNVVNAYFQLNLEDKIRDSKHVMARLIFVKLVSLSYMNEEKKPKSQDILAVGNLSRMRGIPQLLREFEVYPGIMEHFNILKRYVTDNKDKLTIKEIKELMLDSRLLLVDVLQATIELNNLQGIGLLSLGQGLKDYCTSKIQLKTE